MDAQYRSDGPESLADLQWIEIFKDEQLQGLVKTALEQNREFLINDSQGFDEEFFEDFEDDF